MSKIVNLTSSLVKSKRRLVRLGANENPFRFDFTSMPDGSLPAAFSGSTFSISGNKAINTPVLGAEKLNDPGIENWTNPTTPTNWDIYISGLSTINRDATEKRSGTYAAKLFVDGSNQVYLIKYSFLTIGKWYRATVWAKCDSGTPAFKFGSGKKNTVTLSTSYQQFTFSFQADTDYFVIQPITAGSTVYFDDASVTEITNTNLLSLLDSKKSDVSVVGKFNKDGINQGGVACCCNSLINPTSGIFAYTDTAKIFYYKLVNGVYTALGNTAITYVDGYAIGIVKKGSTVSFFYGGVQYGASLTVSNTEIINNTYHGLLSSTPLMSFSKFAIYNNPVGKVMLTFDDSFSSCYTEAYPYMQGKTNPGTIYVITDKIGTAGYCSLSQLQEMHSAGWKLGNHTKDHTVLTGLSQSVAESKLSLAKAALDACGFNEASMHVAYPGGYVDATVKAAMTATGMLTGRRCEAANMYNLATKEYDMPFEIPAIIVLNNVSTLDAIKAAITGAVNGGTIAVFYIHSIVETPSNANEMSIANFRGLVDWMVTSNIQNINIVDFYNKIV